MFCKKICTIKSNFFLNLSKFLCIFINKFCQPFLMFHGKVYFIILHSDGGGGPGGVGPVGGWWRESCGPNHDSRRWSSLISRRRRIEAHSSAARAPCRIATGRRLVPCAANNSLSARPSDGAKRTTRTSSTLLCKKYTISLRLVVHYYTSSTLLDY
jgi:hypothetical protein